VFLAMNGVIIVAAERFRPRRSIEADQQVERQRELAPAAVAAAPAGRGRHASAPEPSRGAELADAAASDQRLAGLSYGQAVLIGAAQILALLAGISRDGVTMVAGMYRGLSRADAARFAFLLATPVIFAAGALKLNELTGPDGAGIGGQVLLGSVLSGIGAYVAVRFLTRYFSKARTLTPFGIYCLIAGLGCVIYLGFIK